MALVLKQVRRCDGQCCRESPRFPNAAGDDCIYHLSPDGKETSGCQLMLDPTKVPDAGVKIELEKWEDRDARDVFQDTCVDWPQNIKIAQQHTRETGGCCWQFVEDGI